MAQQRREDRGVTGSWQKEKKKDNDQDRFKRKEDKEETEKWEEEKNDDESSEQPQVNT